MGAWMDVYMGGMKGWRDE